MAGSNRTRFIVELVGLTAVVISLVFVGQEIRQSTAATRSATQQAILEAGIQATVNVMTNERLRDLLVLTRDDPDWVITAPRDSDYLLIERFYLNRFNIMENAFYQFTTETLDSRLWEGQDGYLRLVARDPLMTHFWSELEQAFMPEFREYMDSTLASVSRDATDR